MQRTLVAQWEGKRPHKKYGQKTQTDASPNNTCMEHKHIRKGSTSVIMKEIEIEITMSYHPLGWLKFKDPIILNVSKLPAGMENCMTSLENCCAVS